MAKGLRFFCDQPYEKGHRWATKAKQLFLVEVLDEEDKPREDGSIEEEVEFEAEKVEP